MINFFIWDNGEQVALRILEEIFDEEVLAESYTEEYMQKSYVDFINEYKLKKMD